jgi:hypothetical protein
VAIEWQFLAPVFIDFLMKEYGRTGSPEKAVLELFG